jgi:hypothetical protein
MPEPTGAYGAPPEYCLRRHPEYSSTLCVRPPGHVGAHHWRADSGRLIQWNDKP